jgi:hypothetical protein
MFFVVTIGFRKTEYMLSLASLRKAFVIALLALRKIGIVSYRFLEAVY